ncbi:Fimbrial protein [Luteimonas sp. 9C]|uniref:PilN domain-containing protein n=1 Tax=Luteimonas sp. 9C TaxID=2653148 RepID=UPI0012F0B3F8|nr:PilN domain-containing protein [Luteimonas sp. 9C]VXB95646.1 Fimbrial protein [Luteimonas sp. 9C]
MSRINLLPWRAERRKQRQKEFGVMVGIAAAAGVALWFLVNMYYNAQIDGQNERNAFLQQQIAAVDTQITEIDALESQRARLLARKAVIEQLQGNRSQMVHLFDQLVRTIPDGVLLTSLKQEGQTLTLEGRSQSNARVSTYMRSLDGSGWMTSPQLSVIEAQDGVPGLPYAFTLNVQLSTPAAKEAAAAEGTDPGAPADVVPETAPVAAPTAEGAAS